MARLKDLYNDSIKDAMVKKFGYKNVNEIPKLEKIVVNMGVGEAKENSRFSTVQYVTLRSSLVSMQ